VAATQDGVALAGRAGGTGTYEVTLTPTTLTADRTLTLPNKTGTVATTGDIGLVYVSSGTFSGATVVNLQSIFSATYDNYRLVLSNLQAASADLYLFYINMLSGSTAATTSYYYAVQGLTFGGSADNYTGQNSSIGVCGVLSNSDVHIVMDITRPNVADRTIISAHCASAFGNYTSAVQHTTATAYDGIQLNDFRLGASTVNLSGTWKLYGYTN
jgi:hypothetical protein